MHLTKYANRQYRPSGQPFVLLWPNTVLGLDSLALGQFIQQNHLDSLKDRYELGLAHMADAYFEKEKLVFFAGEPILLTSKTEGKLNWTLVAAPRQHKLWVVISYPDWGGR